MFKNKLYNILCEVNSLHRTPSEVMEQCTSNKLDRALESYYNELLNTVDYLLSKNSITILKGIVKQFGKDNHD